MLRVQSNIARILVSPTLFIFNYYSVCMYTLVSTRWKSTNYYIIRTALMSNLRIYLMYVGSLTSSMYQPQLLQVWAMMMAHTGLEVHTSFHGTGSLCQRHAQTLEFLVHYTVNEAWLFAVMIVMVRKRKKWEKSMMMSDKYISACDKNSY